MNDFAPSPKRRVLILCTGNSCRSQMAEALVNHHVGGTWRANSAGTEPSGYVHPLAIKAMAEIGIDISAARSKSTAEFAGEAFDLVITVCDDAAENCPVWLQSGEVVHIGFPDPAKAKGTEAERMEVFRQVRDDIRQQLVVFLAAF
ncbi:MAG: arsenate reductase ArsC [Caldilineales bacterium]|nr:arsenate reductase ArsC [Caldilineales bacterium]